MAWIIIWWTGAQRNQKQFRFGNGGCSGGSGQSESALAVCEAQCGRKHRCPSNPGESREFCLAGCADHATAASIFKPGVQSTWAAYLSTRECGVSDDRCLRKVVVPQDPNWQTNPKHQACLASSPW